MWSFKRSLRSALASEAKAYGFTLVIWGTGAMVVGNQGFPSPFQVFAFVGGALTAMALVLMIAFGDLRRPWREEDPERYAFGAIHIVSVVSALLVAWGSSGIVFGTAVFFIVPFLAVLTHQMVLAVEIRLSLDRRSTREEQG